MQRKDSSSTTATIERFEALLPNNVHEAAEADLDLARDFVER